MGLGFRVQGLQMDLGFRVYGLQMGLGFRVLIFQSAANGFRVCKFADGFRI